ncbi:auxin-responsive protein IAA31-like isoform X2 [Salvia hispanica]|uniref:auxin-responsive protein IAA31-like isoform X2 n=1 Tax=Salvia hispanica TaxID=49212 RepID=UPI00200908B3|nr:auxin-responsive protein IAA31-like isoform X2 [Salvia hispanica]
MDDHLQLDLALSNTFNRNLPRNDEKKRRFDELFSDDEITSNKRTLPLLIWNDNRNLDCGCVDVEGDAVVGWPPVNSRMRKVAEHHRRESTAANYVTVDNGGGGGGGGGRLNSMYVKVEMEGIGIARKINLGIFGSYQALTAALMAMFGKRREMYKLTYRDKEGDWLLAGDVPWEFVRSVRRLKLLKKAW